MTLEAELSAARDLDVAELADAIGSIGFECTRCGACCRGDADDHTATVFPEEIRTLTETDREWRDVARPMPFGLDVTDDAPTGETFEWALQVDDCGDCTFYDDGEPDGPGRCTVHPDRPLICQTYPFSIGSLADAADGSSPLTEPMGGVVDRVGSVRAHECEGLGRDISRSRAEDLARTLKERAIRDCVEAIAVRDAYAPTTTDGIVVHDSEGAKRPDGRPIDR